MSPPQVECRVEEFVTTRANPSFGERVRLRCLRRDPDRRDASAGEHSVERGEMPGAVTDEEPESVIVGQSHQQVPQRLGGPRPDGVGGVRRGLAGSPMSGSLGRVG